MIPVKKQLFLFKALFENPKNIYRNDEFLSHLTQTIFRSMHWPLFYQCNLQVLQFLIGATFLSIHV
jgi:hypothetical protein